MKRNINEVIISILIFLIIAIFPTCGNAQISFKIDRNILLPDLRVKISGSTMFPDIRVKIGERVTFIDFTVGITSNKNQADFIITNSIVSDFTIKASEDIFLPDLSIKVGADVIFADVSIKIKKTGIVDYIVYTEKNYININELVIALLPAINQAMDYQFDKIPFYIQGNNQNNTTSNDASDIILTLQGALIFAQDNKKTYLGKIENKYNSESIFNEYGSYGGKYCSDSIWNEYSTFGNKYSTYSPFNNYCSSPPMIVKNGQIIGYLTTNDYITGGISPHILKGLKEYF
jgi:hypothetical protein